MVLFADNKYRYSLQWDAFSEEQIRAGQLMERLGNHKSKVVVPALIEYMERHPEVMLPDGKINIVVQQTQSRRTDGNHGQEHGSCCRGGVDGRNEVGA